MIRLPEQAEQIPKRLAVKLGRKGELALKKGHPWIFEDSIQKIPAGGASGDLCIIFDQRSNQVAGIGLFDPDSPIRIKIIHFGQGVTIDSAYIANQLGSAIDKRKNLSASDTTGMRLVHGENDGFPSLIVDRYDQLLVLKLYSTIWKPYLRSIVDALIAQCAPQGIVLRLGRKVQQLDGYGIQDGSIIYGDVPTGGVVFREHGVKFHTDLVKGHKTGFFLDHRHNRKRVGELAAGKRVLDVFSYAGGFSVHALVGGALEVTSVDISKQALDIASDNVDLNQVQGHHITQAGDAFDILEKMAARGESFDLVVIDPPSFAKEKDQIPKAVYQYGRLAKLGASLTTKHGILVLASCSSRITLDRFVQANVEALKENGRPFSCLETTTHDVDHPIGFPEAAYLKCQYYRMD